MIKDDVDERVASVSEKSDHLGRDESDSTVRLGIMGGTFDPIHYGHLVTAEQAREALSLDRVLFMPTGNPTKKTARMVTDGHHRLNMVRCAVSTNKDFDVSTIELDREGITYTVDTLRVLRAYYPSNVELYFITGADALCEIFSWFDTETIATLATFVGATRPGYDLEEIRKMLDASELNLNVVYIEIPALSISSTYLRERMRKGLSVRYLTHPAVINYAHDNDLYGTEMYTKER